MLISDAYAVMSQDDLCPLRRLGHVNVSSLSRMQAVARLHDAIAAGDHLKLAFANSHVINLAARDNTFAAALRQFLVLPDGAGVDLGARLLYGAPFEANLNGTDFIPALVTASRGPLCIGLLGARPGVAERAMAQLSRLAPQHRYRVVGHGFFSASEEATLLAGLEADRPDLLLVAFGNPRQELWIAGQLGREHCSVAAGVGALFDFLAGEVVRAPLWVRRLRLEWLFRLAQEPGRLWRRYVLGNPLFVARMLAQKWRGRP